MKRLEPRDGEGADRYDLLDSDNVGLSLLTEKPVEKIWSGQNSSLPLRAGRREGNQRKKEKSITVSRVEDAATYEFEEDAVEYEDEQGMEKKKMVDAINNH
ncbi:hypothetical protein C5167_037579 [Papaver somniferum]|uniref:Uncharacterized protein n=1 Tax=Papaver somniferum TaxID=3469 RepID=A0A4Y7IAG3_PAPSO|nr:hypothetical protein C5167_037579 [Papaver somniferum]